MRISYINYVAPQAHLEGNDYWAFVHAMHDISVSRQAAGEPKFTQEESDMRACDLIKELGLPPVPQKVQEELAHRYYVQHGQVYGGGSSISANSPYQLDPDSKAFLIEDGGIPCVVFARTDLAAKMNLAYVLQEQSGQRLSESTTVKEIFSLAGWPCNQILAEHGAQNIKTVIVRPISDETDVYVLDHLPKELISFLSAPLPEPQDRDLRYVGVRVRDRGSFAKHFHI